MQKRKIGESQTMYSGDVGYVGRRSSQKKEEMDTGELLKPITQAVLPELVSKRGVIGGTATDYDGDKNTDQMLSKELECQFFGSFYNDKLLKESSIDLVSFAVSIRVAEVRVIPLGATVEMRDGVALLGSTNPSNFELELYYEDLTDPACSTFIEIGKFVYDHKLSIQFTCGSDENPIITNKVLVRGIYNSVTLAVIGYQVENYTIKLPPEPKIVSKSSLKDTPTLAHNDKVSTQRIVLKVSEEECLSEDGEIIDDKVEESVDEFGTSLGVVDDVEMKDAFDEEDTAEGTPKVLDENFESMVLSYPGKSDISEEMDQNTPVIDDEIEQKVESVSSVDTFEDIGSTVEESKEDKLKMAEITATSCAPVSGITPLLLDAEDISDGDISGMEDELSSYDVGPASPIRDSSDSQTKSSRCEGGERESLAEISEKPSDILSDREFDDEDIGGDLEIISDDEISDYSEPVELSDLADYEEGSRFGQPLDFDSFELHRPKNYRLEVYPKRYLSKDNPLKEKLIEALKIFSESNFKMEMLETLVEVLEEVVTIIAPYISSLPTEKTQVVSETLCFWVRTCFLILPITTPESVTWNLRQLKVTLRLVFYLCDVNYILTNKVVQLHLDAQETTVQNKIVEILIESSIPAVQYLCVKALESTFNTIKGFNSFNTCIVGKDSNSLFEKLLCEFLVTTRLTRIVNTSLDSLIKKVNITHMLASFEFEQIRDESQPNSKLFDNLYLLLDTMDSLERNSSYIKPTSSVTIMTNTMSKYLPGFDAKSNFVKLLHGTKFMDKCSELMNTWKSDHQFSCLVMRIFQRLLKWEVGVVYLAQECPSELFHSFFLTTFVQDSKPNFPSYFAFCMTVMKCVDIMNTDLRRLSTNNADAVIDSLQEVYMLLGHESGRKAITNVFTTGDFIVPLMDIVKNAEITVTEGDKITQLEKTAMGGYGVEILAHIVRTADNFKFLAERGDEIYRLIMSLREDFDGYQKLNEILPFVKPTTVAVNFTLDGVSGICEALTNDLENFLKVESNWGFSPELVTMLRILEGLAVGINGLDELEMDMSTNDDDGATTGRDTMGVKMGSIFMSSNDILSTLNRILGKITEEYNQPAIHAHTFLYSKGEALISVVLPAVRIIRKLLSDIIVIRNTKFRDLTLVPVLLQTYSLVDAFPHNSTSLDNVQKVKVHIIACLQAYTIPVMKLGEESEEELMNSIWTRMMSEVITFTMITPSNFIPGMNVLSELYPLKLPILSSEQLSETVKNRLISLRRLWSAFLHGVTTQFQEMIGILCESTNRELLILVKRVCLQLADLSAASCLVACRGIMEPIMAAIETDLDEKTTGKLGSDLSSSVTAWVEVSHDRRSIQCSARTARLLGFLASLIKKSGIIKAGVMQVIKATLKIDEKFSEFMTILGCILTSTSPDQKLTPAHIKAQEHVLSIFHSFCNLKINMFSSMISTCDTVVDFEYLKSNSLPPKDNINLICSSLLTFIDLQGNVLGNVTVIRKIFFTLNVLFESEFGFYHLRQALGKNSTVIHNLILKLKTKELENLDIVGVMESLEVIDWVLRFLRNLITSQGNSSEESRKSILTKAEFRKLLGWSSSDMILDEFNHPLCLLCSYFRVYIVSEKSKGSEGCEEQQYLTTYMAEAKDKLDSVLKFVNESAAGEIPVVLEVVLNQADSLHDQFTRRPVVIHFDVKDGEQKLEGLNLITKEKDVDLDFSSDDLIFSDLMEIAKDYYKESEYIAEIESFCKLNQVEPPITSQERVATYGEIHSRPKYYDLLGNSGGESKPGLPSGKQNFGVTRGSTGRIGFGRGLVNPRGGFDPFRSRPPNTSRPPSLHVDDFVAMESSGQSSSGGPPIYNKGGRGGNEGFRIRGIRGLPSPLSRYSLDRGRGFQRSTPGSSFFPQRNDSGPRIRGRGRGYPGGNDRWQQPQPGGIDNRPSSNYGGGRQQDVGNRNYSDRGTQGRHFGLRGGGFRDPTRRSSTPGSSNSPSQQRWRDKPKQFNR